MGQLNNEDWEHSDIAAFREAIIGNGVISGLEVTESTTPSMTVAVSTGQCTIDGVVYTETSSQNLDVDNGDATHPRKDIVVYDATAENPAVVVGTPAAAPIPPDIPIGDILLGIVQVEANETTSILNTNITEDRVYSIVRWANTAVSVNTTLNDAHYVVAVDANASTLTISLPTAVGIRGKIYVIKKTDSSSHLVTIDANGTETIDGELTTNISVQYDTIIIQSDNSNWIKLSRAQQIEVKSAIVKCEVDGSILSSGDGKSHFTVPEEFDGLNLIKVGAHVYTPSTSGVPTFQIHNLTDSQDMLSTPITIDITENDSLTAITAAVIDTSRDNVSTGDVIRLDCDVAGTGTKGMEIRMSFRIP